RSRSGLGKASRPGNDSQIVMTEQLAAARPPRQVPSRFPDLREWRERILVRAGFDAALAADLAGREELDVHALLTLVDRGCPPGLAARIVAP
ncbi:MAG: hypothetical protein L0H84_22275, partial [Pseudonocardia sp.]|nr:hypothetical protein [Pseudonocardia sp.]